MTIEEAREAYRSKASIKVARLGNGMDMPIGKIVLPPKETDVELMMGSAGNIVRRQMVTVEGSVRKYKRDWVGRQRLRIPANIVEEW